MLEEFIHESRIAYFSMEIALQNNIPTYSGGLGVLAGDDTESSNGGDANSLYDKLEKTILPLYYDDRSQWVAVMKGAISKNASFFNSHRMMRRYATEAYIR